jgi:rod shape-determining protein MreC
VKSVRQSFSTKYFNKNLLIVASFVLFINYKIIFGYVSKPYIFINKYCFKLIDNIFDFLQSKDDLKEELAELRLQQKTLLDNISEVSKISELGIAAQVIYRDFKNQHYLLVNRGSVDGVQKDMIVISGGKFLGKILQVDRFTSRVALMSDPLLAVVCQTLSTKHEGMCQGRGHILRSDLNFISSLLNVKEGEPVFTTGEGLSYPKQFLVGFVKSVNKNGVYHAITLRLALDPFKVKDCIIW